MGYDLDTSWGSDVEEAKIDPTDIDHIARKAQEQAEQALAWGRQQELKAREAEQRAERAEAQARDQYLHSQSQSQLLMQSAEHNLQQRIQSTETDISLANIALKEAVKTGNEDILAEATESLVSNNVKKMFLERDLENWKQSAESQPTYQYPPEPEAAASNSDVPEDQQVYSHLETVFPWMDPQSDRYNSQLATIAHKYIESAPNKAFYHPDFAYHVEDVVKKAAQEHQSRETPVAGRSKAQGGASSVRLSANVRQYIGNMVLPAGMTRDDVEKKVAARMRNHVFNDKLDEEFDDE